MEHPRFDAKQGEQEIFSSPKRPDWLYVTPSLLLSARGVRPTSQLNTVLKLRICGAVPPLSLCPSMACAMRMLPLPLNTITSGSLLV